MKRITFEGEIRIREEDREGLEEVEEEKKITEEHKKIIEAIGNSKLTLEEITNRLDLDISNKTVYDRISDLREKGFVKVTEGSEGKGKKNVYYVTEEGKEFGDIPQEKRHICKYCGREFKTEASLKAHKEKEKEEEKEKEKEYECKYCGKKFNTKKGKIIHETRWCKEKEEEKEEVKGYRCKICGRKFDTKRGLKIHRGRIHENTVKVSNGDVYEVKCPKCDGKVNLIISSEDLQKGEGGKVICPRCMETLDSPTSFIFQKDEERYKCDICGKYFDTKQGLKIHKGRIHKKKHKEETGKEKAKKNFKEKFKELFK